jgi:hypothetical protein
MREGGGRDWWKPIVGLDFVCDFHLVCCDVSSLFQFGSMQLRNFLSLHANFV